MHEFIFQLHLKAFFVTMQKILTVGKKSSTIYKEIKWDLSTTIRVESCAAQIYSLDRILILEALYISWALP